jgi:transmembrane sensor
MDRNAFHLLFERYLDGTSSDEERRIVDQWYELLDDDAVLPLTAEETNEIEKRLWDKINDHARIPASLQKAPQSIAYSHRKLWIKYLSVAAAVTVFIVGPWVYVSKKGNDSLVNKKVREGLIENTNNTRLPQLIRLEDSTVVILQPDARIAFPRHFAKEKREVYFEGEGFFDVKRNISRPFFVYNNKLVTEVLGTSFNIKIVNNQIEVSVKTGRVAVYENGQRVSLYAQKKGENGVIITPNQKVTYYAENRHFITSLVDVPAPVVHVDSERAPKKTKFVFDDTPVSEVLEAIQDAYEIEIVLENEGIRDCPFTGDITQQNLYKKLEFICQALQTSYEIKGTKILIKGGHSCN